MNQGLTFQEEGHRYEVDGLPLPGITNTLKLTGFVDDSWFTKESRERGTAVHRACWYMAEGELNWEKISPLILPRVKQFEAFLREYEPTLLFAEVPLYSAVYRFAGTFDFIFDIPSLGGTCLVEVKTGRAGLAAKLQTGLQKVLVEENYGFKGVKRFGFELSGKGDYKLVPHNNPGDAVMALNAVAMVHRRINEGELRT